LQIIIGLPPVLFYVTTKVSSNPRPHFLSVYIIEGWQGGLELIINYLLCQAEAIYTTTVKRIILLIKTKQIGAQRKEDMEKPPRGIGQKRKLHGMFMFADPIDVILMILGTIGAIGDGCSTNCLLIFASEVMNFLGNANASGNNAHFMKEVEKVSAKGIFETRSSTSKFLVLAT
jgi:hypothetical protein